jgi:Uma2 family endonuclease
VLRSYCEQYQLGSVISNNAGVVTERNPDTVRGPDVAFYSFARVPRDAHPVGYPAAPPEIVFEVLSPRDRWPEVLAKAAEYLRAGVLVVCVLDHEARSATVYRADGPPRLVAGDDGLALPVARGFPRACGAVLRVVLVRTADPTGGHDHAPATPPPPLPDSRRSPAA